MRIFITNILIELAVFGVGYAFFLTWILEYPKFPAEKLGKKNYLSNYHSYRKKEYIRYAKYFIAPSVVLFALSVLFHFLPFEAWAFAWEKYLLLPIASFFPLNYVAIASVNDGRAWHFVSPEKYCFVKKIRKDYIGFVVFNVIFWNFFGVLFLIVMIIKCLKDFGIM